MKKVTRANSIIFLIVQNIIANIVVKMRFKAFALYFNVANQIKLEIFR